MTHQILFAGPSLHGVQVVLPPGVELRPPAAKGDVLAAAKAGARRIGIIDGTFDYGAAIWHKEILHALDRGIPVLGAASMGALRAAECVAFGMIGVGRIFEDYAAGHRRADADVALVHGPAALGFPPLTDALVDIDATLERLLHAGSIDAQEDRELGARARQQHFKNRRWADLCTVIGRADLAGAFFSQKQADAHLLIDAMRQPASPHVPTHTFADTMFFRELAGQP